MGRLFFNVRSAAMLLAELLRSNTNHSAEHFCEVTLVRESGCLCDFPPENSGYFEMSVLAFHSNALVSTRSKCPSCCSHYALRS